MSATRAKLLPGKSAKELLDLYYLDARMHLLETASVLDRVERARGGAGAMEDARVKRLVEGARLVADGAPERAERFQRLFSDG